MKRRALITASCALGLAAGMTSSTALADEPRIHIGAGAAHALGGEQQREFSAGGAGSATVELPATAAIGLQASAGAIVLAQGASPADPTIAAKATGAAFLGTVGVRLRPLGASRVAGPWVDANGGVAQTGGSGRVAVTGHLGWDFRVSESSRWDVGPFLGYTQIIQPEDALRTDDARVVIAGISVSLGAPERPRGAPKPPPAMGRRAPKPIEKRDLDPVADVYAPCAPPAVGTPPDCKEPPSIKIVADRLVIDDVILFEFGSPRIAPASHSLVRAVASFIQEHDEIEDVSIEGHADARGTDRYNQRLSEARAESTRALLIHFGVEPGRLRVRGFGKSRLRVPTSEPEPENRRVEFLVTSVSSELSGPPAPPPAPSPTPRVAAGKRGRP